MVTITDQANDGISFLAGLSMVFSAQDVADYSGWDEYEESDPSSPLRHTIDEALRVNCANKTVIRLDRSDGTHSPSHYLGVPVVRRWWTASILRWARTDIECVTSAQLAGAMSVAFDKRKWNTPPPSVLAIGQELALVACGAMPGTFVFPWATLIKYNPHLIGPFNAVIAQELPPLRPDSSADKTLGDTLSATEAGILRAHLQDSSLESTLDFHLYSAIEQGLWHLKEREAKVLQLRFNLFANNRRHTLEETGRHFGVTRERIRQIQVKALDKLRRAIPRTEFHLAFASEFMRSGGSLILPESSMTPWHILLYELFGLNIRRIEQLGLGILIDNNLSGYRAYLSNYEDHIDSSSFLPFLSQSDAKRLRVAEEEYYRKKPLTRPDMIREALRSLGRAAHYQEIADECNKLFPNRRATTHSWHAAMSLPSCDALGIVWIGRKGMYGLKEHGYSRPEKGLFGSVADIVERIYAETVQPVSDEVVIAELGTQRREISPTSVKMALSFNDRVEPIGPGRYVPKKPDLVSTEDDRHSRHDIPAAFEAFSAAEDAS